VAAPQTPPAGPTRLLTKRDVEQLHSWISSRVPEVLASGGAANRLLTDAEYAGLVREWVARIAAAAGLPTPPVVVETDGPAPRVLDGGRRVEVRAGERLPWVWFLGAMAQSFVNAQPAGAVAVAEELRPDRLAAHFALQDHRVVGGGDERRLVPRLRGGMALGKENEVAVVPSDNHPPEKTVFARTRLLTVESGDQQPTTMEVVRVPGRVLPAERGWPDRRLLHLAEQDAMAKVAAVQAPTPASVLFPADEGYSVPPEMAGQLVQPLLLPNLAWMSQYTVTLTLGQITSGMRRIAAITPWAPQVHDVALRAADFGDHIAAALAPGLPPLDRARLAGVLATAYGHVTALAISAVRGRLPKFYLPFLSRVSMAGLRRALPDHLAGLLTTYHAYISGQVNGHFNAQAPYGVVPDTDVLTWRMPNGHTIQDFLDNLLLADPAVVITQEIFGANTHRTDLDTHDGRIPTGLVPLEVRAPMPNQPQAPDTRQAQLTRIMRELYQQTGEPLNDGGRTRVEPPWGGEIDPGAVMTEITLPARTVNVDPAVRWLLSSDDAAVLVDPQDGLLRVATAPLPVGTSPDQVSARLEAAVTLVSIVQTALTTGGPVPVIAGLRPGVTVNPLATPGWQVVATSTAYEQTVEATINVGAAEVLPTLLILQQTLDRSRPWYEPASFAGHHLDTAIAWGQQQAHAIGASPAAVGYLALLYLEHAGLVHVLHDALPETYAPVTVRPDLPRLLAGLPEVDQQAIVSNSAHLVGSFELAFAAANPQLIADLEREAPALGQPVNTFQRPLWPWPYTVRASLLAALRVTPADGRVLLDLRYLRWPVDQVLWQLLNQAPPA
jgi:hypothetical protein